MMMCKRARGDALNRGVVGEWVPSVKVRSVLNNKLIHWRAWTMVMKVKYERDRNG